MPSLLYVIILHLINAFHCCSVHILPQHQVGSQPVGAAANPDEWGGESGVAAVDRWIANKISQRLDRVLLNI